MSTPPHHALPGLGLEIVESLIGAAICVSATRNRPAEGKLGNIFRTLERLFSRLTSLHTELRHRHDHECPTRAYLERRQVHICLRMGERTLTIAIDIIRLRQTGCADHSREKAGTEEGDEERAVCLQMVQDFRLGANRHRRAEVYTPRMDDPIECTPPKHSRLRGLQL